MGRASVQRFIHDIEADTALDAELRALNGGPEAWPIRAEERGIGLRPAEWLELAPGPQDLSDDDFENVVGGWDGTEPPPPMTPRTVGARS